MALEDETDFLTNGKQLSSPCLGSRGRLNNNKLLV